jgi:hypothetical protein
LRGFFLLKWTDVEDASLVLLLTSVTSTGIEESTSNGLVEASLRIGKGARVFVSHVEGVVWTFFLGIQLV